MLRQTWTVWVTLFSNFGIFKLQFPAVPSITRRCHAVSSPDFIVLYSRALSIVAPNLSSLQLLLFSAEAALNLSRNVLPFAVCTLSHVLVCERMFLTVGDLYFKMVARRFAKFILMLPLRLFVFFLFVFCIGILTFLLFLKYDTITGFFPLLFRIFVFHRWGIFLCCISCTVFRSFFFYFLSVCLCLCNCLLRCRWLA